LENYNAILSGKKKPRFMTADLDTRAREARDILKSCRLCERACGVDRTGKGRGFCQVGNEILVSSMHAHFGEEAFLIPSFTIFLWSCTSPCVFCQHWTISQRADIPARLTPKQLAEAINSCSCKNINLVGGEPTPQLPMIIQALKHVRKEIPLVWNSNFYMSREAMNLLKGLVDTYLSDFKYGSGGCAERLSGVKRYWQVVSRNHKLAFKDSDLVIRHLVLPNHTECCSKPILDFIAREFGRQVIVNIMAQYRPEYNAMEHKDIGRGLRPEEYREVLAYAEGLGLNFIQ
ncbi:MAG: radical SAM protein, partial [Candidatus Aenigmarchaeota archaeon]|nr:radical SAM protein [Candidatus Aenigmarchaeota archaeon]